MNERILRKKEVLATLGFSSATLHRKLKAHEIDAPLRLGPNMCGWRESSVQNFLDGLNNRAIEPVAAGSNRGRKKHNSVGGSNDN